MKILIIPDGNRRAAKKLNLSYNEVYDLAAERADMAVKYLLSKENIEALVFFGLSFDNIAKREIEEMSPIYYAQENQYIEWIEDPFFLKHQVRVKLAGEFKKLQRSMTLENGLPESYIKATRQLEDATATYDKKYFFVLIGYSGKIELMAFLTKMQKLHSFEALSGLAGSDSSHLLPFLSVPFSIDLVIRTGGEQRTSDCLLYQTAYSEFAFLEKYFPEIEEEDLEKCLREFKNRDRRYGR